MTESIGWLVFTFFATIICYLYFEWVITLAAFLSGLIMSIKTLIQENTK